MNGLKHVLHNNQSRVVLASTQTYRPQDLKMHVKLDLESESEVENMYCLHLDRVVLENCTTSDYVFYPLVQLP